MINIAMVTQDDFDALRNEVASLRHLIMDGLNTRARGEKGRLLTSALAAEKLHVTTRTLLKWRKAGIVKVSQVGRRIYYRESDVEQLIDRNRIEPP